MEVDLFVVLGPFDARQRPSDGLARQDSRLPGIEHLMALRKGFKARNFVDNEPERDGDVPTGVDALAEVFSGVEALHVAQHEVGITLSKGGE